MVRRADAVWGAPAGGVEIVGVVNPLGPGRCLVGHRGSNTLVDGHMRRPDAGVARFRPWRGQSFAIDFFGPVRRGLVPLDRPADPAAQTMFGAELRAPRDGAVVAADCDMPDFEAPDEEAVDRLGDHVILRCGKAEIGELHDGIDRRRPWFRQSRSGRKRPWRCSLSTTGSRAGRMMLAS